MSKTESLTPIKFEYSWLAPSISTEIIAKPKRSDNNVRRREFAIVIL